VFLDCAEIKLILKNKKNIILIYLLIKKYFESDCIYYINIFLYMYTCYAYVVSASADLEVAQ